MLGVDEPGYRTRSPMTRNKIGIRKALSLSLTQTYLSLGLNVATVVIVSRLLTPAEIGVFSVATGLVVLVHMLRDFGVSEFVVQEESLNDDTIETAFTINLIIAWCLAALLFAFSGLIGEFYGDPGVGRVTRVLVLVFMLLPFGTIPMALMRRDMRYDSILKIRLGENIVRSGATIGLAYAGFTYMSMAWASAASMLALTIGCAVWGWNYRVRAMSLSHWRRVLSFGSNRTVADLAIQMGEQSANIIVGKMLGMTPTGLYSRGYGLVNMFRTKVIASIGGVAFSAYAQVHRETRRAPALFLKSKVYVTGISWPFFAFAAPMAFPIIRIAFGNQWDAAVPLMRWLCSAAVVGTLIFQCDKFLTAIGMYRDVTRVELQYQTVRVGLTILAALYSLQAVAASQIPVYALAVVLYYRKLMRYEALSMRKLVVALLPSALLTLGTCAAPVAVLWLWPGTVEQQYVIAFVVAAAGAAVGWLASVVFIKHPLLEEIRRGFSLMVQRLGRASEAR